VTVPDLRQAARDRADGYGICWYSRAGHTDLFPMVSEALLTRGRTAYTHFVCHNRLEAERLRDVHGQANVSVLGAALRDGVPGSGSVAARIRELERSYQDVPLVRCVWSELFERRFDEEHLARHVVGHYDFWERLLTTNPVDVLVSEMPSILSTAIAWTVCRRLGVQFISFVDIAPLGDRMVLSGSWTAPADFEGFETALSRPLDPASEAFGLAAAYLERALTRPAKTVEVQRRLQDRIFERPPVRLSRLLGMRGLIEREKKRRDDYLYSGWFGVLKAWSSVYARRRFHAMVNVFDRTRRNGDKRFFLLPLHQIGEWSNYSWMGLDYADPRTFIWKVSASLPLGYELYVKEHVAGFGERPISFYRGIKSFRSTRVIHPDENTSSLVQRAEAVVTLGSSMGFEALLTGKPVILLGEAWYRNCPGVHRATSPEQLAALMQDARNLAVASREQKLSVLQALYAMSFEGYKVPDDRALTRDNVNRLATALLTRIEERTQGTM